MGKLKDLILGTKEQRAEKKRREAEIKKAEKEAFYQGLKKSRIARARRRGVEAGKGGGGVSGAFGKAQKVLGSELMPRLENLASLGEGGIFDMGYEQPRKKTKRTRKKKQKVKVKKRGKTITITL